ncbi:MAG: mycothiol system anti-sigma-R factor [Actinobacteria bacterium]|nr:mycothiol system anti-sigma-R factor [Actinomycetota bacterium]
MHDKRECSDAVEMLYHYIDGQLTQERRTLIQRHLDDCPPCLDAFDFEAELRMVVAHKCRDQVPEQLRLRVAEAIRAVRDPLEGPPNLF